MNLLSQLLDIYYTKENCYENLLPKKEAEKYFKRMLYTGHIIPRVLKEKVVGYIEVWMVDGDQFNRIKDGYSFHASEEPMGGKIAYVAALYSSGGDTVRWLVKEAKARFDYVGFAFNEHKYNKRLRVFLKERNL